VRELRPARLRLQADAPRPDLPARENGLSRRGPGLRPGPLRRHPRGVGGQRRLQPAQTQAPAARPGRRSGIRTGEGARDMPALPPPLARPRRLAAVHLPRLPRPGRASRAASSCEPARSAATRQRCAERTGPAARTPPRRRRTQARSQDTAASPGRGWTRPSRSRRACSASSAAGQASRSTRRRSRSRTFEGHKHLTCRFVFARSEICTLAGASGRSVGVSLSADSEGLTPSVDAPIPECDPCPTPRVRGNKHARTYWRTCRRRWSHTAASRAKPSSPSGRSFPRRMERSCPVIGRPAPQEPGWRVDPQPANCSRRHRNNARRSDPPRPPPLILYGHHSS
jgi:hypothetical protein